MYNPLTFRDIVLKELDPKIKYFKLKSAPDTIVRDIGGGLFKIVWAKSMESDLYDARWMISSQWESNLIKMSFKAVKKTLTGE